MNFSKLFEFLIKIYIHCFWTFQCFCYEIFRIFQNFYDFRLIAYGFIIIKIVFMERQDDNIEYLLPEELRSKAKSKFNLYRLLSVDLGWFLQSYRRCPIRFLRQLLAGAERILLVMDVKTFDVPQYSKLSFMKLYPNIKETQELNIFFPDYDQELPKRKFMLSVLCTVLPDKIIKLMKDSWLKRV